MEFTVLEHDGLWSLREDHAMFPIFEGRPAVVREYLWRRRQEEGGPMAGLAVEIEDGAGRMRRLELAEMP